MVEVRLIARIPEAIISTLTVSPPVLRQETLYEKEVGKAKVTAWLQILKPGFKGRLVIYLENEKVDEIPIEANPGFHRYTSNYFDIPGVCREEQHGIYCEARAYTITAELYNEAGRKIDEAKTKIWVALAW